MNKLANDPFGDYDIDKIDFSKKKFLQEYQHKISDNNEHSMTNGGKSMLGLSL